MNNIENMELIHKAAKRRTIYKEYGSKIDAKIEDFIKMIKIMDSRDRNKKKVDNNTYHDDIKIKCGNKYWYLVVQYKILNNNIKFTRVSFYPEA